MIIILILCIIIDLLIIVIRDIECNIEIVYTLCYIFIISTICIMICALCLILE